ncbi:MAG: hypothetical protein ACXVY8_01865 [Gaiellaceae bacterium]
MTDLEQALRSLAEVVEWPRTPVCALPSQAPVPGRRLPRPLLVGAVLLLVAVAATMLVPGARSAVLRFFHIGGATIEQVQTLPRVQRRPLAATLGRPVGGAEAEQALGAPVLLPRTGGRAQLYLAGTVVSSLFESAAGPLLVSEFPSAPAGLLVKKLATGATRIVAVSVSGSQGFWIEGPHALFEPGLPPRLAGNVLLWDHGAVTYRLEGPRLGRKLALELARQMTG